MCVFVCVRTCAEFGFFFLLAMILLFFLLSVVLSASISSVEMRYSRNASTSRMIEKIRNKMNAVSTMWINPCSVTFASIAFLRTPGEICERKTMKSLSVEQNGR